MRRAPTQAEAHTSARPIRLTAMSRLLETTEIAPSRPPPYPTNELRIRLNTSHDLLRIRFLFIHQLLEAYRCLGKVRSPRRAHRGAHRASRGKIDPLGLYLLGTMRSQPSSCYDILQGPCLLRSDHRLNPRQSARLGRYNGLSSSSTAAGRAGSPQRPRRLQMTLEQVLQPLYEAKAGIIIARHPDLNLIIP